MTDLKSMIYWEIDINKKHNNFFFNGMITKDIYENIKTTKLNPILNDIKFFENVNDEIYNKYINSNHTIELDELIENYN